MKVRSPIFSIIRGSVGSLTYSSRQAAPIVVYNRFSPTYPRTIHQSHWSDCVIWGSALWESISESDRQGWNRYASTLVNSNPLGPITITGRHAFLGAVCLKRFLNLETAGAVPSTTGSPPTYPGYPFLAWYATYPPAAGNTGFRIRLWNYNPEHLAVVAWISPAFPPTRMRYKGPWAQPYRIVYMFPLGMSALLNFYGLTAGQAYFVIFRSVTRWNRTRRCLPIIRREIAIAR